MGQARDLTDKMLKRARPGRGKGAFREIWDLPVRSLYVRVGKRAKVFWCRPGTGGKRIRLGVYPAMTILEARSLAMQRRVHAHNILNGVESADPMGPTLRRAIERYQDEGCPSHDGHGTLRPVTWNNYHSSIKMAGEPLLPKRVSAISKRLIEETLEASDYSKSVKDRTCRALRTVFEFCRRKKWVTENPTTGLNTTTRTKNPYRVLSTSEIRDMMARILEGEPSVFNCALLLVLASATRPSMIYRLRAENFKEDGAVVEWQTSQMKMSNHCIWYPGSMLRPLTSRLARYDEPFYQGGDEETRTTLYEHYKRMGVPGRFKSAQKTGNTWMQEAATHQKEAGEGVGATMSDIELAARMMTAHTPSDLTAKLYTGRRYRVHRPLLEKASIVLENRISEVTGVDFTDSAVLDVLCPATRIS